MPDLLGGWILGSILLALGLAWGGEVERFAVCHPRGGGVLVLVSMAMVLLYPVPNKVGDGIQEDMAESRQ